MTQPPRAPTDRPASCPADAPPRICFVGLENLPVLAPAYNRHGIGGEQVQHTLLARALARRGFEVSMVVADYGQAAVERIDGITAYRACGLNEGIPVLRFLHPRITKLWAALKQADADVYYVSCASNQLGVVARFAQLHHRRVVFRIAHDTDCEPDQLLIPYWRDKKLYEYGLRRASVVLAQSAQQARALKANYGLDSVLASMLVDAPERVRPFEQREVDVLWVNNLRPFKRPGLALELARRLPQLQLHLVGGPQAGHEALYERTAAEARDIANLHFHGQVPYHDVNRHYESARVFVNTSEVEGFPNSYLQAWRRGTPVVAFFDPDGVIAREGLGIAIDEKAGPADRADPIAAMARQVLQLARSRDDWARASARCQLHMQTHHGDDTVLAPYLQALMPAPAARRPTATLALEASP
ncbi:MAG: glycosyltransferase family 4 protein [Leptothrix sp. (in: b-proteobacteria)]